MGEVPHLDTRPPLAELGPPADLAPEPEPASRGRSDVACRQPLSYKKRMWLRWLTGGAVVAVAAALGGCGGSSGREVVISVTPAAGLYDQARTIVISHLRPGEIVTVTARSARPDGSWSASATFKANDTGVVDFARAPSLSGSYTGVSPMGLFWSEHRAGSDFAPLSATVTTLTVDAGARRLASARVTQLLSGPGVTEHSERLARVGFVGQYFLPPGGGRRPAVVVWGGSEGGLEASAAWAAQLASHGIPALALAYFDAPGLPCTILNIPLEYFVRAIRWLRSQSQVDPSRVWVESGSRGSEPALLVDAHWPGLVHGVVVSAPSSETYGPPPGPCLSATAAAGARRRGPRAQPAAWTLRGKPLAQAQVALEDVRYKPDGSVSEMPAFRAGLADVQAARAARIPVERIRGPVLLISGGDDQLWPSNTYAEQIMHSLRDDPSPHVHLDFPRAGHVVLDIPYQPTPIQASGSLGPPIDLGGTAATDEAARERDWPATISFITAN
jgi:dienelactone hydrolase